MSLLFVSHISSESCLALTVKDWLESIFADHCTVFSSSSPDDIPEGSSWLMRTKDALERADLFLVLCSPRSIRRPWVNFEAGCSWMRRVPVVPICHSGQEIGTLPQPLAQFQALSLTSPDFSWALVSLVARQLNLDRVPDVSFNDMAAELSAAAQDSTARSGHLLEDVEAALRAPHDLISGIPFMSVPDSAFEALNLLVECDGEAKGRHLHQEFGRDGEFILNWLTDKGFVTSQSSGETDSWSYRLTILGLVFHQAALWGRMKNRW